MNMEEFAYVAKTRLNFEKAAVSVLKAIEQKGWQVFSVYDVKERLAAKGFEQKPLKIIEFCSAKYASGFLAKNRFVSLCMPCRINVLQEKEGVLIAGMRPSVMTRFFAEISEKEAAIVESDVRAIIDSAAIGGSA